MLRGGECSGGECRGGECRGIEESIDIMEQI